MKQISITTADGVCPAFDFGSGPSVLFYIDGLGMRPALQEMGERLAATGYRVLMPDLFWRMGPYTPPTPTKLFSDPETRADWFKRARAAASVALIMSDTKAYLAELSGKVGITGYCMGGRMAITAAALYPDRVAAAAAYHPAQLATDEPDSAHLFADKIKAKLYIGAASDDASFPPEQQERLSAALQAAHVDFKLEVYPAKHGWVPSDTPVHDETATEKHWQTLDSLLASTLR